MRDRIIPILSILSVIGIFFMVIFTTPMEVGVLGVLVFFTMIFIVTFGIAYELIKIFQKILNNTNEKKYKACEERRKMYSAIVAFGPIMLLIARAFSVMNIGIIMSVGIFVFLGCFLVHKRA